MPVFLFALSQAAQIHWPSAILAFVILHLLVYPSSNGYNSYMDRDQTPIGGLSHPLQPSRQLFYVSVVMDMAAIVFSFFISPLFALGILLYILASRAYSFRGLRLKQYPVIGFLTVFIFQGALVFFLSYHAIQKTNFYSSFLLQYHPAVVPLLPCLVASLLIGALYPLTQIYQHEEDLQDGVRSISFLLGKRGSFIFSSLLFLSATFLLFIRFYKQDQLKFFYLFLLIMFPVVVFFVAWMVKVWQHEEQANFRNSLRMNIIASICTSAFFITLITLNH
ncbi:MAG: UbiA family prenyltransferase [Flavisolibacter sp.]